MNAYNILWASVSPRKTLHWLSVVALAVTMLLFYTTVHAQAPQIPLTGNIGAGGVFPLINSPAVIFSSDANHTMAYPEMSGSSGFIRVTSSVSLTATRNLIAPLTKGFTWAIENATTGGQSIQVIGATGTGITIPNGNTAHVYSDGTNYVQATVTGGCSPSGANGSLLYVNGSGCLPSAAITDAGGDITALSLNKIYLADSFTNSGCSAKINAALTSLSGPGIVEVTPLCGTISSSISVGAKQSLRFRPGSYNLSATITLSGEGSSLVGVPTGESGGGTEGAVYIRESAGANLSPMVSMTGDGAYIKDVVLDGQQYNSGGFPVNLNPTGGPIIKTTSLRGKIENVTGINAPTSCIYDGDDNTAASGQAMNIEHVLCGRTTGPGIEFHNTNDTVVYGGTETEQSLSVGVLICNSSGLRLHHGDVGGNALQGILITGTAPGTGTITGSGWACGGSNSGHNVSYNDMIGYYQFGGNLGNDIEVDGYNVASSFYTSIKTLIVNNKFIGRPGGSPTAADGILLVNSGHNVIAANAFTDDEGANSFSSAIAVTQTSSGLEQDDTITGNDVFASSLAAAPFIFLADTTYTGNHAYPVATYPVQESYRTFLNGLHAGPGSTNTTGWSVDGSGIEYAIQTCWDITTGFCAAKASSHDAAIAFGTGASVDYDQTAKIYYWISPDGNVMNMNHSAMQIPGGMNIGTTYSVGANVGQSVTYTSGPCSLTYTGGILTATSGGTTCSVVGRPHNNYASIQPSFYATTATMLGPVWYEPIAVSGFVFVRQSGTISCVGTPTVQIMDLGTSPTTAYGSATVWASISTGTSDGVYPTGLEVAGNTVAGHFYGAAFSASSGACATPPTFDITMTLQ